MELNVWWYSITEVNMLRNSWIDEKWIKSRRTAEFSCEVWSREVTKMNSWFHKTFKYSNWPIGYCWYVWWRSKNARKWKYEGWPGCILQESEFILAGGSIKITFYFYNACRQLLWELNVCRSTWIWKIFSKLLKSWEFWDKKLSNIQMILLILQK